MTSACYISRSIMPPPSAACRMVSHASCTSSGSSPLTQWIGVRPLRKFASNCSGRSLAIALTVRLAAYGFSGVNFRLQPAQNLLGELSAHFLQQHGLLSGARTGHRHIGFVGASDTAGQVQRHGLARWAENVVADL